jgi:hypothetical protein
MTAPAPNLSISQADLQALQKAGFTSKAPSLKPPRIACATEGKTKCGKTHWALYTPPEPLAFIMLDPGSLQLADKAMLRGRKIFPKFIAHDKKADQATAKKLWQEFREAVRLVMGIKGLRTLVIDTMTEAWELIRLAEFGKLTQVKGIHYGGINSEFAGLVDEMYYGRPDLNIILTQKVTKQYVKGAGEGDMGNWDGKTMEAKGFGELEYHVDLSLVHGFSKAKGFFFVTKESEATRFGPEFAGLKFEQEPKDECSFVELAQFIFRDEDQCRALGYDAVGADPEYWGLRF